MYSNRIITILNEGLEDHNKISANLATQILGYTGLSSIFCFCLVPKFGRK